MEHKFWHERWATKQIGFHESDGNSLLKKWFAHLGLSAGQSVFLPLCGKTRDVHWLLAQGVHVWGVELSAIAVGELFEELGIEPEVTKLGDLQVYAGPNIDIVVGDFFEVKPSLIGKINAVYDRAALIALPESMRTDYARHLFELSDAAPQLVIGLVYTAGLIEGPPFSVNAHEMDRLYAPRYTVHLLESVDRPKGLKGLHDVREEVWYLS